MTLFLQALGRKHALETFELYPSNLDIAYDPPSRDGFLSAFGHVSGWLKLLKI